MRYIINLCTRDSLPKLIATLDVSAEFDVKTWIKANTDYQRKDVRVSSLYVYNEAFINPERVYKQLNILNIKRV